MANGELAAWPLDPRDRDLLRGRVAIITGAGRGIGREHAKRLAQLGALVVVQDRNDPSSVVEEIRQAGGEASAAVGDIADWTFAESVVQHAVATFGSLHVLVNNAGVLAETLLADMSEEEFDHVTRVNLKGTFAPTRAAVAWWLRAGTRSAGEDVCVVSTTSGAGLLGNPGQMHYGAAKAGVAAMTTIAAVELAGTGIRLNAIGPAARTSMSGEDGDSAVARFMAAPADPREFDRWHPRNISPLVAYLASAQCPFTGEVFHVRGGTIARFRGWTLGDGLDSDGPWSESDIATRLAVLVAESPDRADAGGPTYAALRASQAQDNLGDPRVKASRDASISTVERGSR